LLDGMSQSNCQGDRATELKHQHQTLDAISIRAHHFHFHHHHLSMQKRKRAASEGCCPRVSCESDSATPLTTANLQHLQHALVGEARVEMRTPSPTRGTTTLDARDKLAQYGIHVDTERTLLDALGPLVAETMLQSRDPAAVPSPNAKKIV
jgi:hypothetical protein